jgi:nicotinate-nucleotide pyrophosphorylase (carboxylating)
MGNRERLIKKALKEDIQYGDITTAAILNDNRQAIGIFKAKEDGILAGVAVAWQVFDISDEEIEFRNFFSDGATIKKGNIIAEVEGRAGSILFTERTALNFMQRMSGIATATAKYVQAVEGTNAEILDTRKTVPGLRQLDKEAVLLGGGTNHRIGLYDMYLIKDNHIEAAGSITEAIAMVKKHQEDNGSSFRIEVEVKNLEELDEALCCDVDVIMLDNFNTEDIKKAVDLTAGSCLLEASGGITLENVREVAETGVDFISVGALTHSVKALDISLDLKLVSK